MNLPSIKDARHRSKNKVSVYYDKYNIPESIEKIGKEKTYALLTYGCQMNVHDSENISGIMEELMYTKVEDYEKADVIILNTCAIRENAHNKVIGFLGRIKKLRETNKDIITIITGCMPQEEVVVNQILEKYKHIDLVFGTHNIYRLPELLNKVYLNKKSRCLIYLKQYRNITI